MCRGPVRRAARLIRRRHGRRAWRAIEWEWVRGRLHAPAPGIGSVLPLSRAWRLYRRSLPLPALMIPLPREPTNECRCTGLAGAPLMALVPEHTLKHLFCFSLVELWPRRAGQHGASAAAVWPSIPPSSAGQSWPQLASLRDQASPVVWMVWVKGRPPLSEIGHHRVQNLTPPRV